MPRRLGIPSAEMGRIELFLIYAEGDVWELEWRPLQGSMELPEISKADMDHALLGWTRPLVDQLGPPPEGMLRKLNPKGCSQRGTCPFYIKKDCDPLSKKMPWCFEPEGKEPGILASEVIRLWRQEVYVLVVKEPLNGGD